MSTARTYGNASTALFVVGGAMVAGGVVMWVVGRPKQGERAAAARLVLVSMMTAEGGTVGLSGAW
jgi:hypothetical protein